MKNVDSTFYCFYVNSQNHFGGLSSGKIRFGLKDSTSPHLILFSIFKFRFTERSTNKYKSTCNSTTRKEDVKNREVDVSKHRSNRRITGRWVEHEWDRMWRLKSEASTKCLPTAHRFENRKQTWWEGGSDIRQWLWWAEAKGIRI